jgi:hypothetical protein
MIFLSSGLKPQKELQERKQKKLLSKICDEFEDLEKVCFTGNFPAKFSLHAPTSLLSKV